MARVNGISLKNIKTFTGQEGIGFSASVYLDGKRVGTVIDSAFGGEYDYDITFDAQKKISERIEEYRTAHPILNGLAIYEMPVEEVWKRCENCTLPTEEDCSWDLFFYDLVQLHDAERMYKNGIKKGLPNLMLINFLNVRNHPTPQDRIYQFRDPKEASKIIESERQKGCPFTTEMFSSLEDFKRAL
jgi:hypothetical protein